MVMWPSPCFATLFPESIDSWQLAIPRLLISDFFTGQINTLSFSVSTAKTQHPPALNKLAGRWRHWLASPYQPGGPAPAPGLYTVLTGIDPCLHCIAGTLLTLRPSIALLNPGETGPLLSGLTTNVIIIISHHPQHNLLKKHKFRIFIFFFPHMKILMDLLA